MDDRNKVFENFTEADKLEWIKTYDQMNSMNQTEGLREKMTRKIKDNPFVPTGMLATTLALSFGLYAMRTGNKKRSQLMMRARIGAQFFTIAAILGGILIAARIKPTPSDT